MSWGLVTGATSYIVQVYTDVTLTTRVFKDSLASPPSIVSSLSASTQYYWRVQAINSGGSSGWTISSFTTSASLPNPPSAPTLSSPADGTVNLAQAVTFNWSAVANAVSYHLQESTSSSFSPIVLDTTRITALALTVSLNLNTTYYWRVSALNTGGEGAFSATRSFTIVRTTNVERLDSGLATDFAMSQNYPNPFNPTTTIRFSLPSSSNVRITIYNAVGNLVRLLVNGHYAPGQYSVTWDASSLPSGVYFYRIQTESFVDTKRLVLLK